MDNQPIAHDESSGQDNGISIKVQVQGDDEICCIDGNVTVAVVANGELIQSKTVGFQQATIDSTIKIDELAMAREMTGADSTEETATEPSKKCKKFHLPSLNSAIHAAGCCCFLAVHMVRDASQRLVHHMHLPEWLQDNEFLHFGHRAPTDSFEECLRSIFSIHSETGNIWTHILGCIMIIGLAIYFLVCPELSLPFKDKMVVIPYFVGAGTCMTLSALFHAVSCHSEQVKVFFNKLDYMGIILIIVGGAWPWFHFGFYCYRELQILYTCIMILLGVISLPLFLWDKFQIPSFRPARAGCVAAMIVFGGVPTLHFYILNEYRMPIDGFLRAGIYLITGALFYVCRVPERFYPGKFDIWFQSHQMFHLAVIVGVIAFYRAILELAAASQVLACPELP